MTAQQPDGADRARRTLPAHFREKSPLADTAGVPWAGRDYAPSPFPEDHGETPPQLAAALQAYHDGHDPYRQNVVAALSASRVLVPIMAVATEAGTTAHGLTGDNGADMAMVSLTGPDGSRTLPVFSSVTALTAWRAEARPVPVVAPQAAQAAVQEGCTALLLNPGPDSGMLLPRSVLWALAQGREWIPPHEDPELARALDAIADAVEPVLGLRAAAGERTEVDLHLTLPPGLTHEQLQRVIRDVSARLAAEQIVADRVSSLRLVLGS